jgi:hypothetical protein
VSRENAPLRVFMFDLGAVFAKTTHDAERFATDHGMWDRLPDGTWGSAASEAYAELQRDQQAAYRSLARQEGEQMRRQLPFASPWDERPGDGS